MKCMQPTIGGLRLRATAFSTGHGIITWQERKISYQGFDSQDPYTALDNEIRGYRFLILEGSEYVAGK